MSKPSYVQGMFCWYDCGSTDAKAARGFYERLIGWATQDVPMPGQSGSYVLCKLADGDTAGIYQMSGPQFEGVPSHWLSYVWVDDVDASATRLRELGGSLMAEPVDVPGVGRMAVGADPQGAHFALFKGGEHPGAVQPEGNPQGSFCWTECVTTDVAEARDFYTGLLGWGAQQQDMGSMQYTMFMLGERPVAGMMARTPEMGELPPHWMPYVCVDEVDARARQTSELGGSLLAGPMDVPGVGRFCVIADPSGAAISIITLGGGAQG